MKASTAGILRSHWATAIRMIRPNAIGSAAHTILIQRLPIRICGTVGGARRYITVPLFQVDTGPSRSEVCGEWIVLRDALGCDCHTPPPTTFLREYCRSARVA